MAYLGLVSCLTALSVDYFVILSLQTTDDPSAASVISCNPDASTGWGRTTFFSLALALAAGKARCWDAV